VALVENTVAGEVLTRCSLAGPDALQWRAFYGEVSAAGESWSPLRARAGCAALAPGEQAPWRLRGSPWLLLDVHARPSAAQSGSALDLRVEIRALAGFSPQGSPRYESRVETRSLRIPAGREAFVPVAIAGERERDAFGLRELLLRLSLDDPSHRPPSAYGEVEVSADLGRAAILVDGELAAYSSRAAPTLLPLVASGSHEIALRDPSGREARATVRVEQGRRARVDLQLLPAPARDAPPALVPLGRNPQGYDELLRRRDDAIVVRVPAGVLQMGSADGEEAERPPHAVRLKGFLLDKTEVTWEPYLRFAAETQRPLPRPPAWGTPAPLPASGVTWSDAAAFCAWAGGRLPTEAEWERAARGDDTRRWPWGDEWNAARCNTRDGGPHGPTVAGSHPGCVSPFGVLDLAGSVWEWCADWYDPAAYSTSPAENPSGPASGTLRVSRGGSWINPADWARTSHRQGIDPTWPDVLRGFRCAQDDPQPAPQPTASPARDATPPGGAPTAAPNESATAAGRATTGAGGDSAPRFEIAIESSDGHSGGGPGCEVSSESHGEPSHSWAAFGSGVAAGDGSLVARAAPTRCGTGQPPPLVDPSAPLLIVDFSTTPMLEPAAMDPGPGRELQIAVSHSLRWLRGFDQGIARYGDAALEHRLARLGEDGEFALPIAVEDAQLRAALGETVLLRVRARLRGGADLLPGSVLVSGAEPGTRVLLDGGAAGSVGADGALRLDGVRSGRREVRLEPADGPAFTRTLEVVRGRTSVVSPPNRADPSGRGRPPMGSEAAIAPAGTSPLGFPLHRRGRDGAMMVEVPAGEFLMGSLEAENRPQPHRVRLSSFLIDLLPVTWRQYRAFAADSGRPLPPAPYWGIRDDHPVVFLPWSDARAYCEWVGARLPTEAEREKAARGTDERLFPWGNEPPTPERAIYRRNWGYEGTETVGSRPAGASPYGLLDAGGNVWEWCEDWYDPDYYAVSPVEDPTGPRSGRARILRGGSWDSRPTVLCTSCRNWGYTGYREGDFGFRCAADVANATAAP